MKKHIIIFLFLMILYHPGVAQPPDYVSGATNVTFNCKTLALSCDLPFDNPFVLIVNDVPANAMKVQLLIAEGPNLSDTIIISEKLDRKGDSFYIVFDAGNFILKKVEFLAPGKTYTLGLIFFDSKGSEIPGSKIQRSNVTRTRFGDYVKIDFGFAYSPHINGTFGYTSAHIYFTAINPDADLCKIRDPFRQILLRTSFFFGLSPLTIYSDTKQPVNKLAGAGNFIYGIGFRSPFYGYGKTGGRRVGRSLLQPMRIVLGHIVFKQNDANPLIVQEHVKQSFYIGLSYDINIGSIFSPITKLYTP